MKQDLNSAQIHAEKQKLVNLCFEIGLMISTPGNDREDQPYDLRTTRPVITK